MERPAVRPGDFWRYQRTDLATGNQTGRPNFRVAFANAEVINTVLMRGKDEIDTTFTSEWNVVNDASDGVYQPHSGLLRFPLRPGASYAARYEVRRMRQGAWRSRTDATMKVVGWETVDVKAGRFRALRVEGTGSYQRQDVFGSGQVRWTIWYAPEAKRWVRWTYRDTDFKGQTFQHFTDELIELRLK